MDLIRRSKDLWEPLGVLNELHRDLDRYVSGSFLNRSRWADENIPRVEVREERDNYLLDIDLPGMKKEELDIQTQGHWLTIKGERKREEKKEEKGYFYSERSYGSFSRTLEFPVEIDAAKVKAAYKDGVLKITLPKAESAKPKQVSVDIQ